MALKKVREASNKMGSEDAETTPNLGKLGHCAETTWVVELGADGSMAIISQ